ncbi:MAG TPA: hypothetical protein VJV79_30200 [Polyangiaceae bacterium]|nr:hypothetical protein [Polyangiaceae bacterium]
MGKSKTSRVAFRGLAASVVFVFLAAFVHLGMTAALDARGKDFVKARGFELWEMLNAFQLLIWVLAAPVAIDLLRDRVRTLGESRRWLWAHAIVFFVLLEGPFWHMVLERQFTMPLTGATLKIGVLWTLGGMVHTLLMTSLASIGTAAALSAAKIETGAVGHDDAIDHLFDARAGAQSLLGFGGLVLSVSVLCTGTLRHMITEFDGESGRIWSHENVVAFGVYYTGILTLAYIPAAGGIQSLARAVRDQLTKSTRLSEPIQAGADPERKARKAALDRLKRRLAIDRYLQTEVDTYKTLAKTVPLLAPVLSGLLSLIGLGK